MVMSIANFILIHLGFHGNNNQAGNNFKKFGVPTPVTGSHPGEAVKPGVPHPLFPPIVISLKSFMNVFE